MTSPAEFLLRVERDAQRCETDTATGPMVWHSWGVGQLVVLLHGGAGSWRHWIRNIDELSRHFRLVVPDLPGLGESALPPEPATAQSVAAIVTASLDTVIGADTACDLVGFSFGGVIGAEIALLRADKTRSLSILGSGGLGLPLGHINNLVRVRHLSGNERRAAHAVNLSRQMIADPAKIDDLAVLVQDWNTVHSRLNTPAISKMNSLRRALGELRTDLHAIYGDRDSIAYPYIQERVDLYRALQPNVDFRLIPGAGHWLQYEAAAEVNEALVDILSGTNQGRKS